ncbi:MAG: hypothetical protein LIO79_08395 [Rikenellaceae bacterium]|nr:hypothetical protein [Rikenellaceae bacterium]
MESLPESVLENRKLRSYYLAEYKEYNDILTEVIFYISDAYTISPIDSIADIIDTPPLFKNKGDEKIFSQWVLKKNEIKFPPNFTKLDVDHRGHLVLEVTINKNGELDLKVLKVKDTSSIDKYISNELIYTLKQSPRWKSGIHVGEIVDSKYIVSIVWGHYRGMGKSGGAYKTFDISGKMNINTFKVNGL